MLSLGQDPRWRRRMVDALPVDASAHVLDVATGTGAVARRLVLRHGCRVTAVDRNPAMLSAAADRIAREGLSDSIRLISAPAEHLGLPDASFDGLTVTYLLRYVDDPVLTLAELVRVLRPGAPFASLEFGVPPAALPRAAWRLFTGLLLPAAGAVIGGRPWFDAGRFLHRSIPDFHRRHPLPELLEMHRRAGLEDVRAERMSLGGGLIVRGRAT